MSKYNGSYFYDTHEFYEELRTNRENYERKQAQAQADLYIETMSRLADINANKSKSEYKDLLEEEFEFLKAHSSSPEDYEIAKSIVDEHRKRKG